MKQVQRDELARTGLTVVPGLLDRDELEHYRNVLIRYFTNDSNHALYTNGGKSLSNSFGYVADLRPILKNPRIAQAIGDICGEDIVYLHHCDVHYNRLSSWHKDITGYVEHPWEPREGKEAFALYKIAFYLEDHSRDGNGLTIRRGSHLTPSLSEGEEITIPSGPGDALIFDQRITHRGQRYRFMDKVFNRLLSNQRMRTQTAKKYRRTVGIQDKLSIFWGIGRDNEFSREFSRSIVQRQNRQNSVESYAVDEQVVDFLNEVGSRPIAI